VAQSTISQRIALEGAEDIQRQLTDLGTAGERAIKQIQDATGNMTGLAGLSNVAATVQGALAAVGTTLAPIKDRFVELGEAAALVGERITKTAEVLGIGFAAGLAGGIAGLVELVKSSAEAGHELEVQSKVLGITVEQLQVFRKAAADAGVDADRLTTSLTRFAQNVGKEQETLNQTAVKLFQTVIGNSDQAGVAIVRGIQPAGDAIKSHIIANIQDAIPQINNLVEVVRRSFSDQGITVPSTAFDTLRQKLLNVQGDATKTAETIRGFAAQLGANLPAQTLFEQAQRGAEKAKDPLAAVGITLKDLQDNAGNLTPIVLKAIDGINGIPSTADRSRIALALFSRSWPEVLKALSSGSAGFEELERAVKASTLTLDEEGAGRLSDTEKSLIRLGGAATGLRNQLALAFAPGLTASAEAFTQLIKDNAGTLKDWAQTIANQVLPGLANLIAQFTGSSKAAETLAHALPGETGAEHGAAAAPGVDTSAVDSLRAKFESFRDAVLTVKDVVVTAFTAIQSVLAGVATAINSVFPTNFTATGLAVVLVIGQLSGAFALLLPIIGLVAAVIGALGTPIGIAAALIVSLVATIVNWRSTLAALQGAVAAVAQGVSSNFATALDAISGLLGTISGAIQSLVAALAPSIGAVFGAITTAISTAVAATATSVGGVANTISNAFGTAITFVENAFSGLVDSVTSAARAILGVLQPVFDFVSSIARTLASLGGSAAGAAGAVTQAAGDVAGANAPGGEGGDVGGLGIEAVAQAAGGPAGAGPFVGGPRGTDTIAAWLSPGEFVTRAAAVRHYGADLFHALNAMALPLTRGFSLGGLADAIAPPARAPLMLAGGGPVVAGSGSPHGILNLTIGNERFNGLMAPGEVYDKLARHARASAIRSAGRKPGWFG
jgi:phage-related protein